MIAESKIKALITTLTTKAGITIIRADQLFKKQNYPYATYKVLSSNEESFISNIVEESYDSQTEITTRTTNQASETIISINVFSDSHEEANTKIQAIFEALKSDEVYTTAKSNLMSVILGLTNITDRTIFLESAYEYRFGFDFTIRANTLYTTTKESIEKIGIKYTANLDSGNTNTINKEVP